MSGPEHVVTRINDYRYVCDVCGQAGSERWAILHQFPSFDVEQWVVDQLLTVGFTASTWFPGTEPPTVGGEQP